jgi:type VI secretion system protein ImpH
MGPIARGKFSDLIEDLLQNPASYSAFQALRLIEKNLGTGPGEEARLQNAVSMVPAAETTFPPGEIRHCRIDARERYCLEFNFMGLFGVDSPLPQFFNDVAAYDTPGGASLRGFLELFSRRLYHLLYIAWKKMNRHSSTGARPSLYCRYLEALYGGGGTCRTLGRFDYAGLLVNRIKNGPSLAGLLEDFLQHPVSVRENIPCWIELEEVASLGDGFTLGDNALLGERIMDVSSKILLQIGPLPARKAIALLPGRPDAENLARLIREYLDPAIRYDVEILLKPEADHESALGENRPILGWTACLGKAGLDSINHVQVTGESLEQQLLPS